MNRYKDIMGRVNYALFLAVVALLPFPQIFLRYACVAWIIAWFLELRWLNTSTLRHRVTNSKIWIPFAVFGLWYGWHAVSGLWAEDHVAWGAQMERYITFGALVPVGLWGVNDYYNWRQAGKTLVFSSLISVPIYLFWMALLYFHADWITLLPIKGPWTQHSNWWMFFSDNFSHFKHRLFYCSTLFMAIVAFVHIYREKKWLWALIIPVLFFPALMTGSRQALLSSIAMTLVYILCQMPKGYRLKYGGSIIITSILIGVALLAFHPRMRSFDYSEIAHMRELSYYHDERTNLYGCALQHPSDYLSHGVGGGQSAHYIDNIYLEWGFTMAGLHKHVHNQYLEELIETGIPGLLLFLLAWLTIPLCAQKKERQTALLFTTLYALNMCTDGVFTMFDGIALWAVMMLFIFAPTPPTDSPSDRGEYRD